jgi:hypothetical protein
MWLLRGKFIETGSATTLSSRLRRTFRRPVTLGRPETFGRPVIVPPKPG